MLEKPQKLAKKASLRTSGMVATASTRMPAASANTPIPPGSNSSPIAIETAWRLSPVASSSSK